MGTLQLPKNLFPIEITSSGFSGGFLSVPSTVSKDAISFPDVGNFWLHLLNGQWLQLTLDPQLVSRIEKHNPWLWVIASFRYSVMKIVGTIASSIPIKS
jgi:hypothetical protein